jgi:nitroimidazol reductase NimA-like FMN-containing flavoprotein (pyridoxamine 5'-phosphate oxidase superfamily)
MASDSVMSKQIPIKQYIEDALQASRLAILATEKDNQPHASLIAITPINGLSQLIFVTSRNTRKFHNLQYNGKVAVLIQGEDLYKSGQQRPVALTAFGTAQEILTSEHAKILDTHLSRHPDLGNFMQKRDFALILIEVDIYQVVRDIEDVSWWPVSDLETTSFLVSL